MSTTIPEHIGALTRLEVLSLKLNSIKGFLPPSLANLTHLREFTLFGGTRSARSSISGTFPPEFYTLSTLEIFDVRYSSIKGFPKYELPFDWPSVSEFHLIDNPYLALKADRLDISAARSIRIVECPSVFGTLNMDSFPYAEFLRIRSTELHGTLNSQFWNNARRLIELHIEAPHFGGRIAPEIGQIALLTGFHAITTQIEGTIPPEIANCTKLRDLFLKFSKLSGPLPTSLALMSSLRVLEVSNTGGSLGTLPTAILGMPKLTTLNLKASGLHGTIPTTPSGSLALLDLSDNELEGTIPGPLNCTACLLQNNRLTGTIPKLPGHLFRLNLANNRLGPELDPSTFALDDTDTLDVDLSSNRFSALAPELPARRGFLGSTLTVSHNRFRGTVPSSWANYNIEADHNEMSGSLDSLFEHFQAEVINFANNFFTGTIPAFTKMNRIKTVVLDHNFLIGTPPPVPTGLSLFSVSKNSLDLPLTSAFIESVSVSSLPKLDLSDNMLLCPLSADPAELSSLFNSSLRLLNLARNQFNCQLTPITTLRHFAQVLVASQLRALDLSDNFFHGPFHPVNFPNLVILDISKNRFSGSIQLTTESYPSISQIDISNNLFESDVSTFDNLIFLSTFHAHHNLLVGSILLTNMPKLETLDYSHNLLNQQPSLTSIGVHFTFYSLKVLSMIDNPLIPPFSSMDVNATGLQRTKLSSPASNLTGAICYSLTFNNKLGVSFSFDAGLFSYTDCDCDSTHFGAPPNLCEQCPTTPDPETGSPSGVEKCGEDSLIVAKNSFIAAVMPHGEAQNTSSEQSASVPPNPPQRLHFETETCLILPAQILTRESNCQGLKLTAEHLQNTSNIPEILALQCANGSLGRLCSECLCHWGSEADVCYYEKGQHCQKCYVVFKPSEFIPLLVAGFIVLIIIGTLIMLIALRNKRVQRSTPWSRVHLLKRALHRFLYFLSLGHLSILVTFIQLFMELTHWEAYALGRFLQLTNLNGESLGLRCLFPFLSSPLPNLIAKLLLPFAVALFIVICVGLAEVISSLLISLGRRRYAAANVASNAVSSHSKPAFKHEFTPIASCDDLDAVGGSSKKGRGSLTVSSDWVRISDEDVSVHQSYSVDYPTLALLTTVLISATRFLYFGTALAAHEYLFSTLDAYDGHYYIQNLPYIRVADATVQRWLSIPVIVIFDFLLPAGFIYLCFHLRNSFDHKRTAFYLGSLFQSFNPHCYWWEIVNIFKKLSIALVLRGIPPSNVLQVTLVVTIIAGIQVMQTSLSPWRCKSENVIDALGSVILIGALLAARSGRYSNSNTSVYYVIGFATTYVLVVVALIAHQVWTGATDYQKRLQNLNFESSKTTPEEDVDESHLQSFSPWETEDESNGTETDGTDFSFENGSNAGDIN